MEFCDKCGYGKPCKCLPETKDSPSLPVDKKVSIRNNANNDKVIVVQSRNIMTEQEWISLLWTINKKIEEEFTLYKISATIEKVC